METKERRAILSQMIKSFIGFSLMFFQAFAFLAASSYYGQENVYWIFSVITLLVIAYYRINTWKIARLKIGSRRTREDTV
jgi:Na+/alanine symporter